MVQYIMKSQSLRMKTLININITSLHHVQFINMNRVIEKKRFPWINFNKKLLCKKKNSAMPSDTSHNLRLRTGTKKNIDKAVTYLIFSYKVHFATRPTINV